jgi:hypothetical protein
MKRTGCEKMKYASFCLILLAGFTLTGCAQVPLVSHLLGRAEKTALPEIAFSDDFSDPKSGWDRLQSPLGMTDYRKDAYHMLITAPSTDLFANPGLSFKDVIVEVTAARLDGPDSNNFGVICRYKDEKNFYAAQISSSGYGGIFRMRNGVYRLLGGEQMLPVPAVLGGGAPNRIRFECVGSTLRLAVNGAPVDEREDNHFEIGDVGLIAGTYDQPGVQIAFDDFTVAQP